MKWEAVRENYPDKWLLIEAIDAHSENGKRVVNELSVLDTYNESREALGDYKELHYKEPHRELYVAHSSKELLEIIERKWLGIRR